MRSLISATKIDEFFQSLSRDAHELLPHLVRRLISGAHLKGTLLELRIPVDDEIIQRGYDGIVNITEPLLPFLEEGISFIEVGTGEPKEKAEGEYKKRSEKEAPEKAKLGTFLFITPHRWPDKEEWCKRKKKGGFWRNVRALDSTDLELWLSYVPAVGAWLMAQMGIKIDTIWSATDYYEEQVLTKYNRKIIPRLITNRIFKNEAKSDLAAFQAWLDSDKPSLVVHGETVEEASAFIASAIYSLPEAQKQFFENRCIFCKSTDVQILFDKTDEQIFIPLSQEIARQLKTPKGFSGRLILPEGRPVNPNQSISNRIILSRLSKQKAEKSLIEMGFSDPDANEIASESKGSLTAILWMINKEENRIPAWAQRDDVTELIPLLIAGQWDSRNDEDKAIIEHLCGMKYADIDKLFTKWHYPNGPLIRRGYLCDWLAWGYCWTILSIQLNDEHIKLLAEIVGKVLGIHDPSFEIPPDERWRADERIPHSEQLREGICGSAANAVANESNIRISIFPIKDIIQKLLLPETVEEKTRRWFSIASLLPDLAEICPNVFLKGVKTIIEDREPVLKLFEEAKQPFGGSRHSNLLWALEKLAWNKDFLPQVAILLTKLAIIDPGGSLANRPKNSLETIFLPLLPQCTATPKDRLEILNMLFKISDEVAWEICKTLLPGVVTGVMDTSYPKWHDWRPEDWISVPRIDIKEFYDGLIDLVKDKSMGCAERLRDLIESYFSVEDSYSIAADELRKHLLRMNPENYTEDKRIIIWTALRGFLYHSRAYRKDDESEPSYLSKFDELYLKFEPADLTQRFTWVFSPRPNIPDSVSELDYKEQDKQIQSKQLEAIKILYENLSIKELNSFVSVIERPGIFGWRLAEYGISPEDEIIFLKNGLSENLTAKQRSNLLQAAMCYIRRKTNLDGEKWLDSIINEPSLDMDSHKGACIAIALNFGPDSIKYLKTFSPEAQQLYWKSVGVYELNREVETSFVVKNLLEVCRPVEALTYLWLIIRHVDGKDYLSIDVELVLQAVTDLHKVDLKEEDISSLRHNLEDIVNWLDEKEVEISTLAKIEWEWLPLFEHSKRGFKVLHKLLSEDPKFFIDILSFVFRSKDEPEKEITKSDQTRASMGYKLLSSWQIPPGIEDINNIKEDFEGDITFCKGHINRDRLFAWTEKALEMARESGREKIAEHKIGNVLAFSPLDDDGYWPCIEVCELLEHFKTDEIGYGILIGVINKRGAHWRGEGGEQDRKLVEKFQAFSESLSPKYIRAKQVLKNLADNFERQAKMEDQEADIREFDLF